MADQPPKVAIVYDWLTARYGGAEHVLCALNTIWPSAPLFTAVYDKRSAIWAESFEVVSSFLQRLPWLRRHHRWLLPLLPIGYESLDLKGFDVVISVTSSLAKGVLTTPDQLHLCYLLTPPRYLYTHQHVYRFGLNIPGLSWLRERLFVYLRWWDQATAARPDLVLPISQLVGRRFAAIYNRESNQVIYPPVPLPSQTDRRQVLSTAVSKTSQLRAVASDKTPFLLVLSRLVEYKKVDVALQACQQLGQRLVIAGDGPCRNQLATLAKQGNVQLLGNVSQQEKTWLLSHCQAVLMPGQEDFGIAAMEALAWGKPVLVHRDSGVAELLSDGKDSVFIADTMPSTVTAGVQRLLGLKVNAKLLQQKAEKYATTEFCRRFSRVVEAAWQQLPRSVSSTR